MQETAYAKINLALHVRGRKPDGYHSIETLFAFAEDGDRLKVSENERLSLDVTGPFAAALSTGADNLVIRAAQALRERFGVGAGASLSLDKRLPVAAGLGGGSADAAAALRLLDRWWGLGAGESELLPIARRLGADAAACLHSRVALGAGRGDELKLVSPARIAGTPLLLVNPGLPLSTAEVFAGWDRIDRGPLPERFVDGRNDLEAPATLIVPQIRDMLVALRACGGAKLARMSGSGATCFALFDRVGQRDAAQREIARTHPDWWQLASRLR